jgi:hypothetical protein
VKVGTSKATGCTISLQAAVNAGALAAGTRQTNIQHVSCEHLVSIGLGHRAVPCNLKEMKGNVAWFRCHQSMAMCCKVYRSTGMSCGTRGRYCAFVRQRNHSECSFTVWFRLRVHLILS